VEKNNVIPDSGSLVKSAYVKTVDKGIKDAASEFKDKKPTVRQATK